MQPELPWVLIIPSQDDRKWLVVEGERPAATSMQLHRARAAARQDLELIDAAGNLFRPVKGQIVGIDWGLH